MMLDQDTWTGLAARHEAMAHELTADHVARRSRHEKHPVYDFLFEYYPIRPSQLRRWHPGAGTTLHDPAALSPHRKWRDYLVTGVEVGVDTHAYLSRRGGAVRYIRDLLAHTQENPAQYDCFGLHEWAMVYHADQIRHNLPLRLGKEQTDQVVDSHRIRCTHYDAFRFFTAPARPLNLTVLNRENQPHHDQSGCVHATMDLYKWAAKLGPLVPGDWLLESFLLARDARVLDMEASPYDCRELGFGAVEIETPEGKTEYVRRQRELSSRGRELRQRLVGLIDKVLNATMTA